MRSLGATSTGTPKRHLPPESGVHRMPASWHETLTTMAAVLVGLAAFAFVLVVLPWVISI